MKGELLPDNDNVVRYVKPSLIDDGKVDGNAFHRRGDEEALSINWLDYFRNLSKEQQLCEVRRLFRLQVRPNGRFAELNVSQTRRHVGNEIQDLRFFEDPLEADSVNGHKADYSHALIDGLPDPNKMPEFAEMIGDMIAECVVEPLHRAIKE